MNRASAGAAALAAVRLSPEHRGQRHLGNRLLPRAFVFQQADYDAWLAAFTEAIRLKFKPAVAYCARGIVYARKGDGDKALADFTESIRLDPKYVPAYCHRGDAYSDKRDYRKAIADFTQALQLNPRNGKAYFGRAHAYMANHDLDRAIVDFLALIVLSWKFAQAHRHRGDAFVAKADWHRAIADFNDAIRLTVANLCRPTAAGASHSKPKATLSFSSPMQSAGMAFLSVPISVAAVAMVPRDRMNYATGLFNLARNIGGSSGIATDNDAARAAVADASAGVDGASDTL